MRIDAVLVLLFVIICLTIGIALKVFLKKSSLPYTVALFVVGLIIGIITRYNAQHIAYTIEEVFLSVGDISPDFILYIFLPILIFEASMNMDIHIFRNTFINATILAVPGMIVSLILTAAMIIGLQFLVPSYDLNWSWTVALMFGALISATDPIAVVALLNDLKIKKNFATLVDGESMLNDGTGLVFFMLFFSTFSGRAAEHGALVNFIITVFGAIAVGIIFGLISLYTTRHTHNDPKVQNSILIIAAYILFFLTNRIMEVSGIIALVSFGLMIAYFGPITLKPKSNEFIKDFWELASYIANTIIFIIVGIMVAIKCNFTLENFGLLFIVYIGIYLIRTAVIFLFKPIMKRQRYGLTNAQGIVLSWGGLRGALGLTLALLVAYTPTIPEDIRNQILFLTGGVVTLSLLINATTTKLLLKELNMIKKPISREILEYKIKEIFRYKVVYAYKRMKKDKELTGANWSLVAQYLPNIGHSPDSSSVTKLSLLEQLRRKIIRRNLTKASSLFEDGIISPYTYKRLSFMIEDLDDNDGKNPFTVYSQFFKKYNRIKPYQKKLMKISFWFSDFLLHKITGRFDFLNGFIIIEEDSIALLSHMSVTPQFSNANFANIDIIKDELETNIKLANHQISLMSESFPEEYQLSISHKAKRILLTKERYIIRKMSSTGMLSHEQKEDMLNEVEKRGYLKFKE